LSSGDERAVDGEPDSVTEAFWAAHMRIGFAVFGGVSVAVMLYLATTPHRPDRGLLWAASVGCVLVVAVAAGFARRVAAHTWRTAFNLGWTIFGGTVLAAAICIDRGMGSPLIVLLWLPLIYAGLGLDPWRAAITGFVGLVELTIVVLISSGPNFNGSSIVPYFASMLAASALAVATSRNRILLEQSERDLSKQLAHLAAVDGLTGCLNWRAFRDRLEAEVGRSTRYPQPLALIMMDVDDFKSVNDRFGHQHGDAVLARVGESLRLECRATDMVGRVGGDEFAVLLPQTTLSEAQGIAARLHALFCQSDPLTVTLSFGTAQLDPSNPSVDCLVAAADSAMYEVKAARRHDCSSGTGVSLGSSSLDARQPARS